MIKPLAAVGAAALTLALAPAAAHAAKAFTVGTGYAPDVSVDTSGAANVAWIDAAKDGSGNHPVHYCKVIAGGTGCATTKVLTPPLDTIGTNTVRVFTPSSNRVLVVVYRCCGSDSEGDYLFESTDGGANFGAPVRIGTIEPDGEAIFANEAVYGVSTGGAVFQRMPLSGPAPTLRAELDAGFPVPTYAGVGLVNGTTPIKVSADGGNSTFAAQNGSGDPNDATTWSAPQTLTPPANDVELASGPAGTVLLSSTPNGSPRFYTQKWNGSGFDAPVQITPADDPIFYSLKSDPSGRFTALWVENAASPNEVRFSQSTDGKTWSAPTTILRDANVDNLFNTKVSTAANGKGFGVWDANSNIGNITVAPLEALPDLSGNAGTPDTVATTTVGGVQVSLIAPTSCVHAGDKVALRVTSKIKKKLSPTKRVKITLAVFSVDKKQVKDKKAAFKGIFSTTGFAAGSKHPLKAVVTLKPVKGKGKAKKKTLKGGLTICG